VLNRGNILEAIKEPMKQYYEEMTSTLGNWQPLEDAAAKLLDGKEVRDDEVPSVYLPLLEMMRLIARVTRESEWDWADPAVQEFFKNKAESSLYRIFTNAIVGTVASIIKKVEIGTLVEVGTGPGKVTKSLCEEMMKNNINIPIVISDRAPSIIQIRQNLQESFPSLSISAFVWDIRKNPPKELAENLKKPVLVFERFCLPYAGHSAIDMIAPIADILIMQDDLSLTGKKMAFDILYGKIGTQFLTYRESREHLEKHFSSIHTCDRGITEAINSTVTTFTLAIK
jgi:hypothetical protein